MLSRTKVIACMTVLFAASGWLYAAEAPAPGIDDIAERIFKTPASVIVDDPSEAAICPVCGEPLWKHAENGFVCLPKGRKVRRVKMQGAVCPVCGLTFNGPVPSGMSKDVEIDTDFCRHPIGRANVAGRVWMCPRCGYAAWFERFNKPVSAEMKEFVKERLSAPTLASLKELLNVPGLALDDLSFLQQLDIPDAVKYRNAVLIAGEFGIGDIRMARLALEASHACRRAVNERLSAISISRALRLTDSLMVAVTENGELLTLPLQGRVDRIEKALAVGVIGRREVDAAAAFCLNVTLAGLYDRLGDMAQARACLNAAKNAVHFVKVEAPVQWKVLADIARRRKKYLREESDYRRDALKVYRGMIVNGVVKGVDVLGAGYLVAELYRREGKDGAAKAWFIALMPLAERIDPYLRERMLDLVEIPTVMRANEDMGEAAVAGEAVKGTGLVEAGAVAVLEPVGTKTDGVGRSRSVEKAAPVIPAGRPEDCREAMEVFYQAVTAYRKSHDDEWPPDRETLIREGLLSSEAVNDWNCPESNVNYIYRRPPNDAKTFILFHKNPMNCPCRLILYSDGSIEEIGK